VKTYTALVVGLCKMLVHFGLNCLEISLIIGTAVVNLLVVNTIAFIAVAIVVVCVFQLRHVLILVCVAIVHSRSISFSVRCRAHDPQDCL
jgi:hypothetical protein